MTESMAEVVYLRILEAVGARARDIGPGVIAAHWPFVGSNFNGLVEQMISRYQLTAAHLLPDRDQYLLSIMPFWMGSTWMPGENQMFSPPVFAGSSIEFAVGDKVAILSVQSVVLLTFRNSILPETLHSLTTAYCPVRLIAVEPKGKKGPFPGFSIIEARKLLSGFLDQLFPGGSESYLQGNDLASVRLDESLGVSLRLEGPLG